MQGFNTPTIRTFQVFPDLPAPVAPLLEIANNHWGSLDRGMKLITEYSRLVRFNNVRGAIKLQFRDVDSFIHLRNLVLYNSVDTEQVEREFEQHLGLKRKG